MIIIENVEVTGFKVAIRGMRNPMQSHDRSDSYTDNDGTYHLGINDYDLAKRLCKAGTDHRKFMRMINVTMDITAPIYMIAEIDTYKVGTVRNSCSFMHRGLSKEFELSDFSTHIDDNSPDVTFSCALPSYWNETIEELNLLRKKYLETKNEKLFQQIRCYLPSGYNQKFTLQLNYEVLTNIYHSRRNHKLDEWRDFCIWIETLPYSELITGGNV